MPYVYDFLELDCGAIIQLLPNFSAPGETLTPIFLFDRDGTINKDSGYSFQIETIELTKQLKQLVFFLQEIQVKPRCAVVTNQSGIGRGFYSLEECLDFNQELSRIVFLECGLEVNIFAICPHLPEQLCSCRKPNRLLLELLMETFCGVSSNCVFIGDSCSDKLGAAAANLQFFDINSLDEPKLKEFLDEYRK